MKVIGIKFVMALGTILMLSAAAWMQTTVFVYQGRLNDGGNAANGSFQMQFKLFDSLGGAGQIGSTITDVPVMVNQGVFSVKLDFGSNALSGANRWLEIAVRHNSNESYTTLAPREQIASSPYSVRTLSAASADGLSSNCVGCVQDSNINSVSGAKVTGTVANATNAGSATNATTATNATQLNGQAATFYQNAANLDSGTLNAARLPVPFTLTGTSSTHIIRAENASTSFSSAAVYGVSNSAIGSTIGVQGVSLSPNGAGMFGSGTYGVHGQSASSTNGRGVYGLANASTGITVGVWGESSSTSGLGVYGSANGPTGTTYGVYGQSFSTNGRGVYGLASASSGTNYGVYGQSLSIDGIGVLGKADNASDGITYGGLFVSSSTGGRGVSGLASHGTGLNIGVFGASSSTGGTGVLGQASAGSGTTSGVHGYSSSPSGRGVSGESPGTSGRAVYGLASAISGDARGVYGISNSTSGLGTVGYATAGSGTTYGVYGQADSPDGFGLWASGRTGASGTKSFRIDHPDDPTNKYLLHYSSESPEVINFYRGTVILNDAGEAVVELPSYFAKINKTPSYQLTAVGMPMPMLHVAKEIDEAALTTGEQAGPGVAAPVCSFRIAGGVPGAKVSWRVEAVRNDLWMRERGAPIEVEKQDREKGTYQHPAFYSQPAEKGLNYDVTRKSPAPVRP
jgi:hypothetical protein